MYNLRSGQLGRAKRLREKENQPLLCLLPCHGVRGGGGGSNDKGIQPQILSAGDFDVDKRFPLPLKNEPTLKLY